MTHVPSQKGWDMTDPAHALGAFLGLFVNVPHLLALGEPTHWVDAFPSWRNRIFRALVEEHGYRSIALESDVLAGPRVNAHIQSGEGTLDEVMQRGFSHGFGEVSANRELVSWMREFSRDRDASSQVRFYGFDAPLENMWASSPRQSLLELHTFLAEHLSDVPANPSTIRRLCGDDARWTNEAAGMDATQSVGASEEAKTLRWLADELFTLLVIKRPRLEEQPDAFWHACLHARTAQGLLRYHAVMADSSPNRVARMLSLRDMMMADNLTAIREREATRGSTLVFAHNTHLQRHNSRWRFGGMDQAWVPAGVHVSERMDERYAFIASALGEGGGLPVPPPDTLEGWFYQQSSTPRLYATSLLRRTLRSSLKKRTDTAVKPGHYPVSPLDPEHLQQTDGVLFLPELAG